MAITRDEFLQRQSDRVYDQKLGLEKTFIRDLKVYFAEQRRNARNERPIETIEPVLKRHYIRIIKEFTKPVKKQDINIDTLENYINSRAKSQAAIIDETTQKRLDRSIELAKEGLREDGVELPSEAVIALIASRIFANYNKNRVGGIAVTETQIVAESIRAEVVNISHAEMENAIISGNNDKIRELADFSGSWTTHDIARNIGVVSSLEMLRRLGEARKFWATKGDDRVRSYFKGDDFDHVTSNGQNVPVSQPYIVSGERMMHPGDFSLGASAGNIVGCRCVSVY